MEYNYPIVQGHFYSIQAGCVVGYKCPMSMTFKEALQHAMRVRSLTSVRAVAIEAGVSENILKNIMQGKSATPNAKAAATVADYFGVSVKEFLDGSVAADGDEAATKNDALTISDLVRRLQRPEHRDQVEAFARALLQTEEALRSSE
jgi:transcriptional regulator with XRE-family HTH domain